MSSENQEVAVEQSSQLSGDPTNNTPEVNTDWKANLSDEIRADKSLENIKLGAPWNMITYNIEFYII